MKRKTILITCGVCLLPMIFGVIMYDQLPAQIPIHWNVAGKIDNYASKAVAVFILPLMMAAIQLFCMVMMKFDPKHKNYSEKMQAIVIWIIPVMTLVLESITYAVVFGYDISINTVIPMLIGGLFIILGNYLPKCRQNYTVGIKLPWTLNDEDNWNKTNRLGGYIMVIGGFLITIMGIFGLANIAMFIVIPSFLVIPSIYSFLLFRKNKPS